MRPDFKSCKIFLVYSQISVESHISVITFNNMNHIAPNSNFKIYSCGQAKLESYRISGI